ncbi:hypothetical protein X801_05683 [Opisthorchis viverrini]|uniref:Uncharacterized protein n=2 Tax=Opisthorchis viverrini TaxID=6198 RepID=A0A074ZA11_OPIVI|nr:hypothetical protein T265_11296 [Opisthorchis viverrini]KER20075.1 hypothetical protein T265_11296 [Opisthorchis viverrini]OON18462.1 hypothetical protein X801_05683 [Opisthorchis viverrini]
MIDCLLPLTGRGTELWPSSEVVSISVVPKSVPSPVTVRKGEKISFATLQTVAASEVVPQRVRLRIHRNAVEGDKVEDVDVDHVIIDTAIKPNTQTADSAGLEIDPVDGGFLVNADFEARAGILLLMMPHHIGTLFLDSGEGLNI